ncbi:TPA: hypothetical protein HA251_03445 [Candidatus Woesearchaeota archaeon]|nr:hypothetical protein [Candidatus Woesearchaeota archaeon]
MSLTDIDDFNAWFRDYCRFVGTLGNIDREAKKIAACYTQKGRHYHNLRHILDMRDAFLANPMPRDAKALEFAIMMHDAVYDPKRHDNEERSAKLATEVASRLFMPKSVIELAPEMILATDHKRAPESDAARHLVDLDLLIFAMPRNRLLEYDDGIRAEYRYVDEETYRRVRADVLGRFEARSPLYLRPCFAQYETIAKENLRFLRERLLSEK